MSQKIRRDWDWTEHSFWSVLMLRPGRTWTENIRDQEGGRSTMSKNQPSNVHALTQESYKTYRLISGTTSHYWAHNSPSSRLLYKHLIPWSRAITQKPTVPQPVSFTEHETSVHGHNIKIFVLIHSQMKATHIPPPSSFTIHFNILSIYLPHRCAIFTSDFPTKIRYSFLFSLMCATCPNHLVLIDFINIIIYCEQDKS